MNPRFIKLHPRTVEKLIRMEKKSISNKAYRVSRRILAVLLNHDGMTSTEIALVLKAPRSKVSEWLKVYAGQGFDGLMELHRSGRPSRMEDVQKLMLCDIVDSGPVAYGFLSGVWTSKLIAKVIKYEFNVVYHPSHVWKLMQEFGFSVQSPKRVLAMADNEKRRFWIDTTYPAIKKKHSEIILD